MEEGARAWRDARTPAPGQQAKKGQGTGRPHNNSVSESKRREIENGARKTSGGQKREAIPIHGSVTQIVRSAGAMTGRKMIHSAKSTQRSYTSGRRGKGTLTGKERRKLTKASEGVHKLFKGKGSI